MLTALYEFYANLFNDLETNGYTMLSEGGPSLFGYDYSVAEYFSLLCSLISLIIIVVLSSLFVYKIIKLIGGLIR